MAARAQPVARVWPGIGAAAVVAALILGTLAAVALRAEAGRGLSPSDWAALRFTVMQAALSAVFSVVLAVPVARALARRAFAGRQAFITLLGAPFILPVIVAVLGLLAVFGRRGVLNAGLEALGMPAVQIYGLFGVVLAHVFLNLPLAVRLILQGWQTIPAERFRLAASLDFGPGDMWRVLERPMLLRMVPGAAAVIFAICLSSFAVVLTLGGGPRATTVELAIYHAFRFDFDLGRAALLSCLQIAVAGAAALIALRLSGQGGFGAGMGRPVRRWDARGAGFRAMDAAFIGAAALFLIVPLAMVLRDGIEGLGQMPADVWRAAGYSIGVALVSTVLMLSLALPMAVASARWQGLEAAGLMGIAASPLVMGTGLFIIVYPFADPGAWALAVTALVNAVMSLPFALRVLAPAARDCIADYGRLSASLGLRGRHWLRLVLLPRLRRPLGFAAGLAAALSMGDLGVIALFSDPERATLPLQMYRLMGSYRTEAASGAGLLLLALTLAVFWGFDKAGRYGADD
ncbi:thiamine transport system permease protein [Salinihabitans flavidus]|uniref:Thiamine transport system permease protein n=1 Tax=Salinihabitans flavidus TaxID=569882 RepID=A0A1H8LSX2_9RHOB|nr:thiamine/thiamine pyrophosphate ABC transporter permease ThiP [Salinihabitans flavidus]SEO08200.1 thiamine transport system permease protein [Salinihabitans flavidus]